MADLIAIHSFLRGAGKTHLIANMATLLSAQGRRIGVVDADLLSPDLHLLFDLPEELIRYTLIDYLNGRCTIDQAAYDVTPRMADGTTEGPAEGRVYLIPASSEACEVADVLRHGYDVERLKTGFDELCEHLRLDLLLVDTHAGLSEETLALLAVSTTVAIVLKLDRRYYQGTAVTVEVARRLEVPELVLIAGMVTPGYDAGDVAEQVRATYGCDVAAVLPYYDGLGRVGEEHVFALRHPEQPLARALAAITSALVEKRDAQVREP